MNELNKYFDVVINKNSYYLVEKNYKPQCAEETLAKIEFIIKNNLAYDKKHVDQYSNQTPDELIQTLDKISTQIHKGYTEKQSKLSWLFRRIFSHEKQISEIHSRINSEIQIKIHHYAKATNILPLPPDMFSEIFKYLDIKDLKSLALVNKQGYERTKNPIAQQAIKKAKSYGYEGNDYQEAKDFLNKLSNELNLLAKKVYRVNVLEQFKIKNDTNFKIDVDSAMKELKDSKSYFIWKLFDHYQFYENDYKIVHLFLLKELIKTEPRSISYFLRFCDKPKISPLGEAIRVGRDEVAKVLLEIGADPNLGHPLEWAAKNGNMSMVELLIKKGADINLIHPKSGFTPLVQLIVDNTHTEDHNEVADFLLEKGAHPDLGFPLHLAIQNGNIEIVKSLIKHHADLNLIHPESGLTPLLVAETVGNKQIIALLKAQDKMEVD